MVADPGGVDSDPDPGPTFQRKTDPVPTVGKKLDPSLEKHPDPTGSGFATLLQSAPLLGYKNRKSTETYADENALVRP